MVIVITDQYKYYEMKRALMQQHVIGIFWHYYIVDSKDMTRNYESDIGNDMQQA